MLSRRHLRMKVMQVFYACQQKETYLFEPAQKQLQQSINSTHNLYLYTLFLMREVAAYVKQDKVRRAAKYLPTEEDKNLSTVIFDNPFTQKLFADTDYNSLLKARKLTALPDMEMVKKIYKTFSQTEDYQKYTQLTAPSLKEHAGIMRRFLAFLYEDETFIGHIEEKFANWDDDAAIISDTIKTLLYQFEKKGPANDLHIFAQPEDWNEKLTFCTTLLQYVLKQNQTLTELIQPHLQHWDVERLTQIDILLLKLAICEFLYFPTIPTRVTINEYIEIAKVYSTPSSKNFINGVLDKVMKSLNDEGKIQKTDRHQ